MLMELNEIPIPQRIKGIYESCTDEEKYYLRKILEELAESDIGYSKTYQDIWLADYKEIPVDIDTFLCADMYLGRSNSYGEAIYPYWRRELRNFFGAGNKYWEWVFTGATRIGKSSIAVVAAIYMLYRLMCLRDPQKFFRKESVSQFSLLFFNLTEKLAAGVAFHKFNDAIRVSPWFLSNGQMTKSVRNPVYVPNGNKIIIDTGSDASHGLGQQVFCLVGSTEIVTDCGIRTLRSACGETVNVAQLHEGKIIYTPAQVEFTDYAYSMVRITLLDGTVIEGTPDHRIMLADKSYKYLGDITLDDIIYRVDDDTADCPAYVIKHESYLSNDPIPVYDVINAEPSHNFLINGVSGDYVSHNCALMDEVNFSQAGIKDSAKAKKRMKETYDILNARIQGTFKYRGEVFGKMFAVSSKNSDSDFMEDHIREMRDSGGDVHMYVSDAPQWEVMPPETFSTERFTIAVGGQHQKSFVVPEQQDFPEALHDLEQQGFLILHPPVDMRPNFKADFNVALRDLAGISVAGAMSFITQESITQCTNTERRNPFYSDILQIGTQDNYTIAEFFHQDEVPAIYKTIPIFIHLDLALVNDRAGISGVGVIGRTDVKMDEDKIVSVPKVGHMFSVAIEAPRGDRIAFGKIVAFIRWLRKVGYNIFLVSRDQFQSDYLAEELESQGFKTAKFSLDRTPDGYLTLQAILLEKRIDLLYSELLQTELIHLQKDNVTNKVDHPVGGCFTANTKIILADGRNLTIAELLIEQTYQQNSVYTYNRKFRCIEIKPIKKVFCTKLVTELTRITLDDGSTIECTHDHRFMCSDMKYVEAQNLSSGTSLMCLSMQKRVKSVERVEKSCLVYDLEIDDNHNFALSAGVFVHNSKDLSDSLAGAVFQCLQESPGVTVSAKHRASAIAAVNGSRGSVPMHNLANPSGRFPIPGITNRK